MGINRSELHWVVSSAEEGMTLLSFLRLKCAEAPSVKALKRAIDGKCCTVNGQVETFSSHPLKKGAEVVLDPAAFSQGKGVVAVIYEDDDLLICNKPAGMLSQNLDFNRQLPHYGNRLELVHRLDKETSGVIILAKNAKIRDLMFDLFAHRHVHKVYLALVDGEMAEDKGKIDNYLEGKQRAITHWKCLQRGAKASLVLCEPLTGRTHQLRIHLSSIGHPILGDLQYGKRFACKLRPRRHLLHAYATSFTHPLTQKKIEAVAPVPLDFKEALQVLW